MVGKKTTLGLDMSVNLEQEVVQLQLYRLPWSGVACEFGEEAYSRGNRVQLEGSAGADNAVCSPSHLSPCHLTLAPALVPTPAGPKAAIACAWLEPGLLLLTALEPESELPQKLSSSRAQAAGEQAQWAWEGIRR